MTREAGRKTICCLLLVSLIPKHRTPPVIPPSTTPTDIAPDHHTGTDYEFVFASQAITFSVIDDMGRVTEQHDHFLLELGDCRTKVLKQHLLAVTVTDRTWETATLEWTPAR